MPSNDEFTLEYYMKQAELCGDCWSSTMQDEVVRSKEIDFILLAISKTCDTSPCLRAKILDLGCGNGYVTEIVAKSFPHTDVWGGDFCDKLLGIAKTRQINNCQFTKCDARKLDFTDGFFDLVYTERCLINIRDWDEQRSAIAEVARVIKPGGIYVMIECFLDGHLNYNKARLEIGLREIHMPDVNLFFDKERTMQELEKYYLKDLSPAYNFLSSHYFVARVLHPAVCRIPHDVRNSEFVKFFSEALPPVGNYSPIQGFVWIKK